MTPPAPAPVPAPASAHLRLVAPASNRPAGNAALSCISTLRLQGVRVHAGQDIIPSAWRDLLALLWSNSGGAGEVIEVVHDITRTPLGQPQRYAQWIRLLQRDRACASATVAALPLAVRSALPSLVFETATEADFGEGHWVERAVLRPAPVVLLSRSRSGAPRVRRHWAFPAALPTWKMTAPLDEELCEQLRLHCRFSAAALCDEERRLALECLQQVGAGHTWVMRPDVPQDQASHHPELATELMERLRAWVKGPDRGFRFEAVVCTPEGSELSPYVARRLAHDLFGAYPWTLTAAEEGHLCACEPEGPPLLNEQGLPGSFVASAITVSKFRVPELSDPPAHLPKGPGAMIGTVGGQPLVLPHAQLASHILVDGGSGTGKSSMLLRMIQQDIDQGLGVTLIDPHGALADELKRLIPPQRQRDVVWIDVDDPDLDVAINPMEGTLSNAAQRTYVAGQLLHLIKGNGETTQTWGPAAENHLRQCFLLAMHHPTGGTIFDAARLLEDDDFCDYLLSKVNDESLGRHFKLWRGTRGENGYDGWRPWLLARLHPFTKSLPMVRLLQRPSTLDLAGALAASKILIFRLGKATLSEIECQLLGSTLLMEYQRAALARARLPAAQRPLHRLVVDEFQTFCSESTPVLFREARKYNLGIVAATQSLSSLARLNVSSMKDAVLANTATKIIFRVSPADAHVLDDYAAPHYSAADLMRTRNFEAVVCMSAGDVPPLRVQMVQAKGPPGSEQSTDEFNPAAGSALDVREIDDYLARRHGISF